MLYPAAEEHSCSIVQRSRIVVHEVYGVLIQWVFRVALMLLIGQTVSTVLIIWFGIPMPTIPYAQLNLDHLVASGRLADAGPGLMGWLRMYITWTNVRACRRMHREGSLA